LNGWLERAPEVARATPVIYGAGAATRIRAHAGVVVDAVHAVTGHGVVVT
jgi:hypothetical protein